VIPIRDDIPTRRFPVLTVAIIAICCAVYFLFERGLWDLGATGNERVFEYGAIPYEVTNPGDECLAPAPERCEGQQGLPAGAASDQAPWWITLFTSMFLHGSLLHLGGNMLFLWIFGNNIEDSMGRVRFIVFYLLGGLAALGLQIVSDPDSAIPTVGASGAIAAVLGGYALLYPRARVITLIFIIIFFTVIELPAMIVLGLWFAQQVFFGALDYSTADQGGGGVAYFAHIGGFLFGLLTVRLLATRVKDVPEARRRRELLGGRDAFGR
jgi:membrane associated rhomboid family serine protease